ncbi:MAG: hypothetical protein ACN6PN_04980 [Sphingobacterium sp.]
MIKNDQHIKIKRLLRMPDQRKKIEGSSFPNIKSVKADFLISQYETNRSFRERMRSIKILKT